MTYQDRRYETLKCPFKMTKDAGAVAGSLFFFPFGQNTQSCVRANCKLTRAPQMSSGLCVCSRACVYVRVFTCMPADDVRLIRLAICLAYTRFDQRDREVR